MADDNGRVPQERLMMIAGAAGVVLWLILWISGAGFLVGLLIGILLAVALFLFFEHGLGGKLPTMSAGSGAAMSAGSSRAAAPPEPAPAPKAAEPDLAPPDPEPARAADPEPVPEPEPEPAPKPEPEPRSEPAPAPEKPAAGAGDVVKPSTPLPGEAELAGRKGSWTYGELATPEDDATEEEPADLPEVGGPAGGTKPELLGAAREGGPDDLKKIKGVGPKLESVLHSMGVFHFDQIAAWGDAEIAWMDSNLQGFKGRVSRDGWVEQAKSLAAGN